MLEAFRKRARLSNPVDTGLFVLVVLFFFVSGGCGLLYQVVWTRKLVLLFGTTSYAVSTVLSIFFLGLGLGSIWGGRLADRTRRPLFFYGVFEIAIGLWALCFILCVDAGEAALIGLLRAAAAWRIAGIGLRAALAVVLLIVPVTLMGATLPLLAKFVGRQRSARGWRIGALYSINTFGAVAGCAATGFILLARFGYTRTTLIGAAANVAVGLLALAVSWTRPIENARGVEAEVIPPHESAAPTMRLWINRLVIAAFALSGFCALALEVLWTRMLVTVFLGTTYAFTTMLTALLCGIAAGSAFASLFVDRRRHPVAALGVAEFLFGLACVATLPVYAWLPEILPELQRNVGYDWDRLVRVKFILAFAALFAPAFLSGMTFPLVVRAATGGLERLGRDMGRLYSANTFGGVAGAIAGGYLVLPVLGVHNGVMALGTVLMVAGCVLVAACPTLKLAGKRSLAALVVVVLGITEAVTPGFCVRTLNLLTRPISAAVPLLATPGWIAAMALILFLGVMTLIFAGSTLAALRKAGIFVACGAAVIAAVANLPADVAQSLNTSYLPPDHEVIFFKEGVEGTVAVAQPEGDDSGSNRVLYINGVQATASIEKGVRMNRLQGALPLLFNRDPRTVLFMCFGSGITAGTLGLSDFDRIDAVEIAADVLEAAPLFAIDNLGVHTNPRVNFVIDDGRNFLLTTRNKYDVITFEPMPLALAGVSTFYTREYYELCLSRLTPGGIVSQWVPLHSLNLGVVQSLTATFASVFPEYCAWFINADVFLIGSNQPIQIDYQRSKERTAEPAVRDALAAVGLGDLTELLTCFLLSSEGVNQFAQGQVMTDDRPWAEFEAPKLMYESGKSVENSLRVLRQFYECPMRHISFAGMSPAETENARVLLERRCQARAHDLEGLQSYYGGMVGGGQETHFIQALDIDPNDYTADYYLRQIVPHTAKLYLRWNDFEKTEAYLMKTIPYVRAMPELHLLLADARHALGKKDLAREAYETYRLLGGSEVRAFD